MNHIEFTRALSRSITALMIGTVLASCSGDETPAPTALSGVAAVGYPIVRGTINVVCVAGVVPAITTSTTGAWQVSAAGLTLPCAVQVSSGSINGTLNIEKYHSLATSIGTVNITPLTDLIVANIAQRSDPDVWFTELTLAPTRLAQITPALVDIALANVRTALANLTPLNTINPITTVFTPTAGNATDDMLVALQTAMTSVTVTHATLLNNMSQSPFISSIDFNTALTTAVAGTVSGGALPLAPAGVSAVASNGQVTITWDPVAVATSYKLYMDTQTGISKTTSTVTQHPSVSSPFVPTNLINGTTYYFVVTAVNVNGESIESAEVSATPQPLPVVTLTATPSSIASGATSTLDWSSTHSTSCTSSGSGGTGTTGSFTTPALTANTTYTVTCTGVGGSASQIATVTVAGALTRFSRVTGGCVLDSSTGLMWEVKTTDGGLRDWDRNYTNYDNTEAAQKQISDTVFVAPTLDEINAPTNSVGFKNDVNAQGLCGFNNWRLPTVGELQSIIKLGSQPTIDTTWFPNTRVWHFWSASPFEGFSDMALQVYFDDGDAHQFPRFGVFPVRLVRAGQ